MFIKKVTIKNFRSISNETFECNCLNIFVGNNDVGKSNFLKALNLFFNGQTDSGQDFKFVDDYCAFTPRKKRKAAEIAIEIIFTPPISYNKGKAIKWRKVWRKAGLKEEKTRYADNKNLPPRARVGEWLRHLVFKYVPAIKGTHYFSELLRDLHNTLFLTLESEIKKAGEGFITNIKQHTENMHEELLKRLEIESNIQLPEDLSTLFSTLDFKTKNFDTNISLKRRGDGIKARHIPIILRFLATHEKLYHPKGAPRSSTIWGYEEPENNLEISRSFDLADEFAEYSKSMQIFLTTHSPAFYSMGRHHKDTVNIYDVVIQNDLKTSKISLIDKSAQNRVDKKMGLLPLIAPYIDEKQAEIRELRTKIKELDGNKAEIILFVEGDHDKQILENAWQKLRRRKQKKFFIQPFFDRCAVANLFKRGEIFRNSQKVYIGMLDFDEAFEDWERIFKDRNKNWELIEKDVAKGLLLKNKKNKGYVFLLPVPTNRQPYASQELGKRSVFSLELLFSDKKIKKFTEKITSPGGGHYLKFKDDKKKKFAELTKSFVVNEFENFKPIFLLIDNIIRNNQAQITNIN